MIAHLTGTLLLADLELIVLDVNGVGYEVHIPAGAAGRLKEDDRGQVALWIHTSVREDAIQLYGFARRDDRRLFRRLTSVNGVGPRTALATLSELSPSEVVRAVASDDIKTFTRVSGIGKKTAQRLILELKNKLDDLAVDATA
jgi:holliday junction DNA helicase RuvA